LLISFLKFNPNIYDFSNTNKFTGDGVIKLEELKSTLTICSEESGMKFTDEQMNQLTWTLFEDAKQCESGNHKKIDPDEGIGFQELKAQMSRQPGLLESLSTR